MPLTALLLLLGSADSRLFPLCCGVLARTGIRPQAVRACAIRQHDDHCGQVLVSALSNTRRRTAVPLGLSWQKSVCGLRFKVSRAAQTSATLIHRHFYELLFIFSAPHVTPVASPKPACYYTSHQPQGRKPSGGRGFTHPPRAGCLSVLSTAPETASVLDKRLGCESQAKHRQLMSSHQTFGMSNGVDSEIKGNVERGCNEGTHLLD